MDEALVLDAVRRPIGRGKPGGALSGLHPVELLAQTIAALLDRTGVDPRLVEDVGTGCVSQVGEQYGNVGRMTWLGAGLPEHVAAVTVERKCGSSQQAVHFAAGGIASGQYDRVVVAGVESMSRVPMGAGCIDDVGARLPALGLELAQRPHDPRRAAAGRARGACAPHRRSQCGQTHKFPSAVVIPTEMSGRHIADSDWNDRDLLTTEEAVARLLAARAGLAGRRGFRLPTEPEERK